MQSRTETINYERLRKISFFPVCMKRFCAISFPSFFSSRNQISFVTRVCSSALVIHSKILFNPEFGELFNIHDQFNNSIIIHKFEIRNFCIEESCSVKLNKVPELRRIFHHLRHFVIVKFTNSLFQTSNLVKFKIIPNCNIIYGSREALREALRAFKKILP